MGKAGENRSSSRELGATRCQRCRGKGAEYHQARDGEFVRAACERCGSGMVNHVGTGLEPRALPGDLDLDFDVSGVVITAVVRHECEFIVDIEGGTGRWFDNHEGMVPVHSVSGQEIFGLAGELGSTVEAIHQQFDQWCAEAVPIRITKAPGKSTIFADDAVSLTLPRGRAPERKRQGQ